MTNPKEIKPDISVLFDDDENGVSNIAAVDQETVRDFGDTAVKEGGRVTAKGGAMTEDVARYMHEQGILHLKKEIGMIVSADDFKCKLLSGSMPGSADMSDRLSNNKAFLLVFLMMLAKLIAIDDETTQKFIYHRYNELFDEAAGQSQ